MRLVSRMPVRGRPDDADLGQAPVIDKDLTAPPGAPSLGDRYIVASVATGAWTGQEDDIAQWGGSAWSFETPIIGVWLYVEDEKEYYSWNGTAWVQESAMPHASTHASGGTDELTSAMILEAQIKRIQESSGPTSLLVGQIDDADYLARIGTDILGRSPIPQTGFENRTDTDAAAMNGANLEIAPKVSTFNVYSGGKKIVINSTLQWAISTDLKEHFCTIDSSGVAQVSTTRWSLVSDDVHVATVYKDGANYDVTDERHGARHNQLWHQEHHNTVGTTYKSGLTGSFLDASFSIAQGVIYDEDIEWDTGGAETVCSLFLRTPAVTPTTMTFTPNVAVPYLDTVGDGSGILQWDDDGAPTNAGANKYVAGYVYARNSAPYTIAAVVGQAEFTTQAGAEMADLPSILLDVAEWKLLYRVVYRNVGGTATYISAQDFRRVTTGQAADATALSHAATTARDAPNAHPAAAIAPDASGFVGMLSTADDTAQKALATLDNKVITRITDAVSPYTVLATDRVIFADTDAALIAITLLPGVDGKKLTIINVGTSGNDVTITPDGAEKIDTAATRVLTDGQGFEGSFQATEFWRSSVVAHNGLTGLQGGAAAEYYHQTAGEAARYESVTRIDDGDSPYTALATDSVIFADTDAGAITINLLPGVQGGEIEVVNVGSAANDVTLTPDGTEEINLGGAGVAALIVDGDGFRGSFDATEFWRSIVPVAAAGGVVTLITAAEDMAAILNAATSDSSFWLGDGSHVPSAQIDLSGKDNISIMAGRGAVITEQLTTGVIDPLFLLGDNVGLHFHGLRFALTADAADLAVFGFKNGTLSTGITWDDCEAINTSAGNRAIFIDYKDVTGDTNDFDIRNCQISGHWHGLVRLDANAGTHEKWRIKDNSAITTATGSPEAAVHLEDGGATAVQNMQVEGNQIENFYRAVHIDEAINTVINDNNIIDPTVGINVRVGSSDCVISGNSIKSSSADGILTAAPGTVITGNIIDGSGTEGIQVSTTGCIVNGNIITNSTTNGIDVTGTDNTISNNIIDDPTDNGIDVTGADNIISGNRITDAVIGIDLAAGSDDCVVSGNSIDTTSAEGILIADSDDVTIVGNSINTPGTYGIHLGNGGDNCVVDGNQIDNPGTYGIYVSSGSISTTITSNQIRTPTNGIHLAVGANRSIISGNGVFAPSGIGINILSADCAVASNLINTPTGVGISSTGLKTVIDGNVIFDGTTTGISATETATITDNYIYSGAGGSGISVDSAVECVVTGNHIDAQTGVGIDVTANSHNSVVSDNVVNDSSSFGIQVATCDRMAINGNKIDTAGATGLRLSAVTDSTINSNTVTGSTGPGITMVNVDTSLIAVNRCAGNSTYGIEVDASSDGNRLEGNLLEGNTAGGLLNLGADNEIDGKVENTVSTTDATVTTISTIEIPDDSTVLLEVAVMAFRTNGADQAAYKNATLVYRRSAGNATIENATEDILTPIESDASWDVTIAVSGTTALVRVTGDTGLDINWKSRHTVEVVS